MEELDSTHPLERIAIALESIAKNLDMFSKPPTVKQDAGIEFTEFAGTVKRCG